MGKVETLPTAAGVDWLHLQFLLRPAWQHFAKPRLDDCRAAASSPHPKAAPAGIDAAVRSFARGDGWPALSEEEMRLLGARLHFALCWVTANCSCAQPPFQVSDPCEKSALEFLLIDAWHNGGVLLFGRIV